MRAQRKAQRRQPNRTEGPQPQAHTQHTHTHKRQRASEPHTRNESVKNNDGTLAQRRTRLRNSRPPLLHPPCTASDAAHSIPRRTRNPAVAMLNSNWKALVQSKQVEVRNPHTFIAAPGMRGTPLSLCAQHWNSSLRPCVRMLAHFSCSGWYCRHEAQTAWQWSWRCCELVCIRRSGGRQWRGGGDPLCGVGLRVRGCWSRRC
jgi:hypothetical protein